MQLYSQRDPSYDRKYLGNSKRTIHSDGCFLVSIATLYQRSPVDLLDTPGAFVADGNLVSDVLARECGGAALAATTTPPKGWCIAMTDYYSSKGFATHFFVVNAEKRLQIDPLDLPMKIEPLLYPIKHYRPFTNTRLEQAIMVPPIFPDVLPARASYNAIKLCKERGLVNGYPDGLFRPEQTVTREEMCIVIARLLQS